MTAASELLLPLTLLLPVLAAMLLAIPAFRGHVIAVAPWTTLPSLILALSAEPAVAIDVPWLLLDARLAVDDAGRVFLFSTAGLWLLSGLYARAHLTPDASAARFFAFFLVTMTGNLGVVVAGDMATFYCSFAVMSFSAYGLVIHDATPEAFHAGRIYMTFIIAGEVLLFVGIVGMAGLTGASRFSAVHEALPRSSTGYALLASVAAGFAIKTAAVPLHSWLPLAYRAAPAPASAVLSGPIINAGVLGWLRLLPLGVAAVPVLGMVCIVGGFVAAFWGVIVGVTQKDAKATLGYSSISQMGLLTTLIGAGLLSPPSWPIVLPAVCLFAFHHAAAKAALFLGADVAARTGAGVTSGRLALAGLLVPALAIAGAPLTSGAAVKVALKGVFEDAAIAAGTADWLLSIAAVGTTLLMARFLVLAGTATRTGAERLPLGLTLPWLTLVAGTGLFVWVVPWMGFANAARTALAPAYIWTTTWPLAVGAALAWWIWRRPQALGRMSQVHIPAGDLLVLVERRLRPVSRAARQLAIPRLSPGVVTREPQIGDGPFRSLANAGETWLQQWNVVGLSVLVIAAAIFLQLSGCLAGGA